MPTGLTADAGWQIGVSRTLDAPIDLVWDLVVSDEGVALWLAPGARLPHEIGEAIGSNDGGTGQLRSRHARDRVRLRWRPAGWDHTTVVQVAMAAKGERTAVTLHQERLADADERERQRDHWRAVMDRLAAELLPDPSAPAPDPNSPTSASEAPS